MSSSQKPGSKPEKTMSSRLLTMKVCGLVWRGQANCFQFMQRAAASAASKEPSQPSDEDPHTPKKQRLSTGGESQSPAQSTDLETISAAVAAEEDKRKEAIARQAAESGETEWVLDYAGDFGPFPPLPNVVAADSLDDDEPGGRRSYGNFKRKKTGVCSLIVHWCQLTGKDTTDMTDSDQIDSMIEKEKQKSKKPVNVRKLKTISGGRPPDEGESAKKRKHK